MSDQLIPLAMERPVYSINSKCLPYPAALAGLLRRDSPERHYASVISAIFDRHGTGGYRQQEVVIVHRLRRIIERSLVDDAAAQLVLMLVPTASCCVCGRLFLRETQRRSACSDACRRAWHTTAAQQARLAARRCLVCLAPLRANQLRFCSRDCQAARGQTTAVAS